MPRIPLCFSGGLFRGCQGERRRARAYKYMDGNYIKISRNILDWEWYRNINTKVLFFHMLLKANWKDGKFEGKVIPRGSFVSSIAKLSLETDLTAREIRTAIEHLKTTGEVTVKSHSKYSVFTIDNYCLYQVNDTQNDKQKTDERQADDRQLTGERHSNDNLTTTIEEGKEVKREEDNIFSSPQQKKIEVTNFFETIWELYPVKRGKAAVSFSQRKKLYQIGYEPMQKAIKRYEDSLKKDAAWRSPQNGSTFFNKGYLDYLGENYKEPIKITQELPVKQGNKNQFHNFEQRGTDYDALVSEKLMKMLSESGSKE